HLSGQTGRDALSNKPELGLEMALIGDHADLLRLVTCFDDLESVRNSRDERFFAADVATGAKAGQYLVNVLGMRGCDHDRIRFHGGEHLVLVRKLRYICQVRMGFLGELDLLRGRVDKGDDRSSISFLFFS